jgi:hypothetical protein
MNRSIPAFEKITPALHSALTPPSLSLAVRESSVFSSLLLLGLFSNYFEGVFQFGAVDDLAMLLVLMVGVSKLDRMGMIFRSNPLFVLLGVAFILVAGAFLFEGSLPFAYELFKILNFTFFIPVLATLSFATIRNLDRKILKFAGILFSLNLLVICFQYVFSPYAVTLIGMPQDQVEVAWKAERWVGFFEGVNILGDAALLFFFFNELVRPKGYRMLRLVAALSVFFSTSKHAILLLIFSFFLLLLLRKGRGLLKKIALVVGGLTLAALVLFASIAFLQEDYQAKFRQYLYFSENIGQLEMLSAEKLERRGLNIAKGILIFQENPGGVGLGVWGDASAAYNPKGYPFSPEHMSDSSFIHLLVEQGIFLLLYLCFLFSGGFSVQPVLRGHFLLLVVLLLLINVVTMGLSSGGWPILFGYIYARMFVSGIRPLREEGA